MFPPINIIQLFQVLYPPTSHKTTNKKTTNTRLKVIKININTKQTKEHYN